MDVPTKKTSQDKPIRSPRGRLQYSLRWLLVIVTLSGIGLGLLVRRAERQRNAVAAIRADSIVQYDFEEFSSPPVRRELPGPDWLCRLLGVDYFADVVGVVSLSSATDATAMHLSELTNLRTLDLAGTQVSDAGLAHLAGLTNLQQLHLEGTQVGSAGLAHLSELTNLRTLDLAGTQVSDAGLAHLAGLTNLRQLHLEGTQVGSPGLAHLSGLTSLQSLHLNGTQVGDAGLVHLSGLTSLQGLDLYGTRVTDAGRRRLEAALPKCSLVRR